MFGLIPFSNSSYDIENEFEGFMRRFFNDEIFPSFNMNMNMNISSPMDIKENENNYAVRAKLPGVSKEDISLEYKDNNLIISVQRNIENCNSSGDNRQMCCEQYTRSFYIDNVDETNIRARFVNDELQIILPKKFKTSEKTNRINIE